MQELENSKQDLKSAIIAKGVTPTGGLSSYAEAVLSIPASSEMTSLSETITENGEYNFNPIDDGVEGYSMVDITVDIPIPTYTSEEKSVTITQNGTQSITPSEGYDGLSKVDVTVNVASTSGKPQIPNGFRFTGGDIAQVDFSQYDWSMVYDTSQFFAECSHSTGDWSNFLENFNGRILSGYEMFGVDTGSYSGHTNIPHIDTSKVVDMTYMFARCDKLTTIPQLDTSNVMSMNSMFEYCLSLTTIPQLDTSKVVDMSRMFLSCSKLTSIPQLDTSNVMKTARMFDGCSSLTTIPQLDTSKVTNMTSMFSNCTALTTIPLLDTSSVTNMSQMFYECTSLTSIPQLDASNVTTVSYMFKKCTSLISLGNFETLKLSKFYDSYDTDAWLYRCSQLQKLGVVDCDSVTDIRYFFSSVINTLTEFGGCRNLGKKSSVSNTNSNYFLNYVPNLTYESVMNILNGLYDRASAGLSVLTLKLHANHLAMLSEDDIAIATNKGWTIV